MKPTGPVFDAAWRARSVVEPADRAECAAMIHAHYIGKWPGVCVLILALCIDGRRVGVCVFALPPRETHKRYGCTTWELARLWIEDGIPANAETFFIAASIKYIRKNRPDVGALVSYADPSVGHSGTIYRASNWKPDGRTDGERKTPRFDYACADTGKKYSRRGHVPEGTRLVRIPRVSKHRYVYRLSA